jgi:hypothetical protein
MNKKLAKNAMNLYGDVIRTKKKESARQVLFESKPITRT